MCSSEALVQEIAELAARVDAATHRLLTCIRQFDQSNEWHAQGAVSCAHWLSWRIGLDLGTAREKVRVSRALGALPLIDEAFREARLSYAKVRAMTRIATVANETALLELALSATGAQLERICRGCRQALTADQAPSHEERSVRRRQLPGGMVKLEIVLAPDEADLLMRAIDCSRQVDAEQRGDVSAETSAESKWPSRADGIVTLAAGYLAGNAGTSTGGDHYQVSIHVDQDPLAPDGTMAATLEDGSHVSAETFRRIACDCGLVAMTGNGDAPLGVGRRTRSISPALRRALRLRDRGCVFPGCRNDRFLHGHHVQHWLHGGETNMDNLIQLCSHHHQLVHEGGWSVVRGDEGAWTFVAPTGKSVESIRRQAWQGEILTWLQEWSDDHGLDLGPDGNLPLWDGTRPDYDLAVGALVGMG
jgi:hypothetical protein